MQHQHAIGYWKKSGRRDESESFVELGNFGIEFVRHLSMPATLAKTMKYRELNSGFISTVSYISGEHVVEK